MKIGKRILSFVMVAVIMLSVLTLNIYAAGEQTSVSLIPDKQYAKSGDVITITINIESNYNATCMRWPILYSNNLELVGANGEFSTTAQFDEIGGSSVINPNSNDKFFPDEYSSADYSALLIQWTGGVEDNNVIIFNKPEGLDCYTVKFKVKDSAVNGENGEIFIPQNPSSYTPFYNQAVIINGDEIIPYKANDLVFTFNNATVTIGEEPSNPQITTAEGSSAVIDDTNKIIYGLDEAYSNLGSYIKATDGAEINFIPTASGNGTGSVVQLMKQGEVLDSYTIVIFGDLTGDAFFNEEDIVILNLYSAFALSPEEDILDGSPRFIACDLTHDDLLDERDKSVLNLYLAYIGEIDQTTGTFIAY